jgi:hypothetical protein
VTPDHPIEANRHVRDQADIASRGLAKERLEIARFFVLKTKMTPFLPSSCWILRRECSVTVNVVHL